MNDKAQQLDRQAREREEAIRVRDLLKDTTLQVFAKGGGAGACSAQSQREISDALKAQCGIELDRAGSSWTSPSRPSAVYTVRCKLGYEITASLKLDVRER
jgi:large subunit ribosomal protein L9